MRSVDSPDGVLLTGAPPAGRVTIEATLELGGQSWTCAGEYVVDRDGEVDTAEDASSDGSYRGVDPFGLFWSAEVSELLRLEHPAPDARHAPGDL